MIAHRMSLCQHPFYQIRAGIQIIAHHEEGGGRVVLLQGVQNRRRIAIFKAAVEGQIKFLFRRFFYVISVIFF